MRVAAVVGARPNFVKVAPVRAALVAAGCEVILVHTGQHSDEAMSRVFFDELGLAPPEVELGVGGQPFASRAARSRAIRGACGAALAARRPDFVLVAGDVDSTLAGAQAAADLGLPVAHLEAGLRSHDWSMPEEANRVLTDRLSALLLTPSADADANLAAEGIASERVFCVGNAMIDTLRAHEARARARAPHARFGLAARGYALVTLHRPAAVDGRATLGGLVLALRRVAARVPVLFPAHPRTQAALAAHGLADALAAAPGLRLLPPLGYLDFLGLEAEARLVLTDSGGVQEETTALGVPCLTLRHNTERPVTVTAGTNTLVGLDPEPIEAAVAEVLATGGKQGRVPELWDGATAIRVVEVLSRAAGARAA